MGTPHPPIIPLPLRLFYPYRPTKLPLARHLPHHPIKRLHHLPALGQVDALERREEGVVEARHVVLEAFHVEEIEVWRGDADYPGSLLAEMFDDDLVGRREHSDDDYL